MNKQEAIDVLEEVKILDDSMYQYCDDYMRALDYVLDLVKHMDDERIKSDKCIDRDSLFKKSEEIVKMFEDDIDDCKEHPNEYTEDFIDCTLERIAGAACIQQLILEEPFVTLK